jgi:UDP-glucose 4-epimerase
VRKLTGRPIIFIRGDITALEELRRVFLDFNIVAVMHFAGLKSTYESLQKPLKYYKTNVYGTINLLECMGEFNCCNLVFSSSGTVYGAPVQNYIEESHPLDPLNPYGRSKLQAETIIRDYCTSHPQMKSCILRYFNPAGNHDSGVIGEDPSGIPNNLMPYLLKVLGGKLPFVNVFGNDYDTKDGTGVRDFIHVVDLAKGHLAALRKIMNESTGCFVYNMGTGAGYSVMDIIHCLENVSGMELSWKIAKRRPGDAGQVVANPQLAWTELNWKPQYSIQEMCEHAWKWQKNNPDGYNVKDHYFD